MQLILAFLISTAHAGSFCDRLATDANACTNLSIEQISSCIRKAEQSNPACLKLEGKNALAAAVAPAFDIYIQKRAEQHKQIYGN